MAKRLTVHNENSYDIVITNSFESLSTEIGNIMDPTCKFCIVTDSNVDELYSDSLINELNRMTGKVYKFVFKAGEENKNLNTVENLYEYLIANKFERRDVLIALGGGVVGDLTGFTAATYLRGISFIQVPTTLLAQVDSSIGGKTGVDVSAYKNMVGAFYMPKLVYMNLSALNTLDDRVYSEGFGEIIKHAYICDKKYLKYINDHILDIKAKSYVCLEHIIYRSCQIKGSIVEEDPKETGIRAVLNFGHTLGHSIEKLCGFSLYHGECVILGMICSLSICEKRNYISKQEYEDAIELFKKFNFKLTISGIDLSDIIETAKNDKKMDKGSIKFILLNKIGDAYIDKSVTDEEMSAAINEIIK